VPRLLQPADPLRQLHLRPAVLAQRGPDRVPDRAGPRDDARGGAARGAQERASPNVVASQCRARHRYIFWPSALYRSHIERDFGARFLRGGSVLLQVQQPGPPPKFFSVTQNDNIKVRPRRDTPHSPSHRRLVSQRTRRCAFACPRSPDGSPLSPRALRSCACHRRVTHAHSQMCQDPEELAIVAENGGASEADAKSAQQLGQLQRSVAAFSNVRGPTCVFWADLTPSST
jgi:hypothetical protein